MSSKEFYGKIRSGGGKKLIVTIPKENNYELGQWVLVTPTELKT